MAALHRIAFALWMVGVGFINAKTPQTEWSPFLFVVLLHAAFEVIGWPAPLFSTTYRKISVALPLFGLVAYAMIGKMDAPLSPQDAQQGFQATHVMWAVLVNSVVLHVLLYKSTASRRYSR